MAKTNDDFPMSQDAIERLFRQTMDPAAPARTSPAMPAPAGGKEAPLVVDDELEKLLSDSGRKAAMAATPAAGQVSNLSRLREAAAPPAEAEAAETVAAVQPAPNLAAQDIEYLLAQAEQALESVDSGRPGETPAGVSPYRLPELSPAAPSMETATLDLIRDVELASSRGAKCWCSTTTFASVWPN